jgi:hypothetical protein
LKGWSGRVRGDEPGVRAEARWAEKGRERRGYGTVHKATRERYAALVASGLALSARYGLSIAPGAAWDLAHTDDRSGYSGPEHRKCNQLAGARKGAAVKHARYATEPTAKRRWSQNWNAPHQPPPDVIVLSDD